MTKHKEGWLCPTCGRGSTETIKQKARQEELAEIKSWAHRFLRFDQAIKTVDSYVGARLQRLSNEVGKE